MNEAIAIRRSRLSRPLRAAIDAGVLTRPRSYFDYGMGLGDDVRLLRRRRYKATGWDPHHSPDSRKRRADVVGLLYVLNVIPSARRRNQALRDAAALARRDLVVAVRTDKAAGVPFRDGVRTAANTFQKNYERGELARLVKRVLGRSSHALAPGVVVVNMR